MFRRVVLAACAAGLVVSGCSAHVEVGRQVAKAELEKGISDALEKSVGQRPDSIVCPGPIKAVQGEHMRCELLSGSTKLGLTATINSVDGSDVRYGVQVDDKPMS
ncbi:DUF4333 domain-containing protein [Amycolatopsis jiangsuensis]|uniref:Putative component of type VI protein secretion system n=1 Tax=Amycolatopsis jiangsuensis TaxID=1181879 RepID=A0A840IW10_9PSEU|nr:DUF4333 domain-containing protein [Amycolatopsis jiangsuensis]MBB4685338.1 putative component of type VI protein secretion system [Amycolatopsis jiangsuensis]